MSQSIKKNSNSLPVLPSIQINTPCHMDWDSMTGDAQKRFCGSCQKHVHDLSKMDTLSAHDLLAQRNEEVCVRLRRNTDGSIVTKDNDLSRRNWLGKLGTTVAGLTTMLLFGGCRDPFVQGEIAPGDVVMGEAPVNIPEQPSVEMGKPSSPEVDVENDAADNADDLTKALTENPWRLSSPSFAFELESTASYKLVPFKKAENEFHLGFGRFVEFKDGKFKSYNVTMCGNDVSKTVTGTYERVEDNKIKIFVKHIERNDYCKKKSESPEKSYGIYSLSRNEDGSLQITKDKAAVVRLGRITLGP